MKMDEQVIFGETTTVRSMIVMADDDRGGARGDGVSDINGWGRCHLI